MKATSIKDDVILWTTITVKCCCCYDLIVVVVHCWHCAYAALALYLHSPQGLCNFFTLQFFNLLFRFSLHFSSRALTSARLGSPRVALSFSQSMLLLHKLKVLIGRCCGPGNDLFMFIANNRTNWKYGRKHVQFFPFRIPLFLSLLLIIDLHCCCWVVVAAAAYQEHAKISWCSNTQSLALTLRHIDKLPRCSCRPHRVYATSAGLHWTRITIRAYTEFVIFP